MLKPESHLCHIQEGPLNLLYDQLLPQGDMALLFGLVNGRKEREPEEGPELQKRALCMHGTAISLEVKEDENLALVHVAAKQHSVCDLAIRGVVMALANY